MHNCAFILQHSQVHLNLGIYWNLESASKKKLNGKESDDQEMNYKNSLVDAQLLFSKNILWLLNEEFNKEIIKGIFIFIIWLTDFACCDWSISGP